IDIHKVRKSIQIIKRANKRDVVTILKIYLNLMRTFLAKKTLIIESVDKLHPRYIKSLTNYFERSYKTGLNVQTQLNKALLGGLRISLGDTQWDLSISEKINQIKETVNARHN
ncbi:MAG: hypothetical protein A2864_00580, partial [Candidatus Woykebacteria bacterium RIFCSPHIGHO2_01_FULL_39_12]